MFQMHEGSQVIHSTENNRNKLDMIDAIHLIKNGKMSLNCSDTLTRTPQERSGSGVELRNLDYENPGSNPVLRC